MFRWDDKYNWRFGGDCVDGVGPNESDSGLFEGHPYKSLAKEILQNSLDAKVPNLPDDQPVEVEFKSITIPIEEIPGFTRLNEVIGLCSEYYNKGDDGQKVKQWKDQADMYLAEGKITVLKISDYYTTGLSGVTELKDTNWSGLVREKGASNKSEVKGGSHGVGKFAPYSFSSLRTVLYSTKSIDGETAFQGKTMLTSFMENGQVFHNIGVYGAVNDPKSAPIFDMDKVPENFQRIQNGTDVIVVGFDQDAGWMDQITLSVLQYCFYAIHQGRLNVRISDGQRTITIDRETLSERMNEYEKWYSENGTSDDFQFTAPKYYQVLSHPKMKHFTELYDNRGEIELFLVVDPDLDGRSIYQMRSTGMGIQEDTGWKGISSHFNGIFIATGNNALGKTPETNIDSFLRKCEDSAHNEWLSSVYKGHEGESKRIIEGIHKWIRAKIIAEIPKFEGVTHDAFELDKYIQNTFITGNNTEEEDAFINYEPQSLEIETLTPSSVKKIPTQVKSNGKGKGKKKKGEKKGRKGGNPKPANQRGKKEKRTTSVDLGEIWTPFEEGLYHIRFKANESYEELLLKLFIGGDEQSGDIPIIKRASIGTQSLKNYYGTIIVGSVSKGTDVDILVELDGNERMGLEVVGYAQQ